MKHLSDLHEFYRGKRILITGHTGFKGGWLAFWLHALGAQVIGYSLPPATNPNFSETVELDKKIVSIFGDIRNRKTLEDTFKKHQPEIVFHMAAQALVRPSYRDPVGTYETNVMGTVYVLEACRATPSVRAVVNITSDKCYENTQQKSYREEDPMGGHDPYSSSKGCSELVTQAYIRSYFNPEEKNSVAPNLALASGRAGNVIGGGDWAEDRLIPDCIRSLTTQKPIVLRYPAATRPWQHVLDALHGYLLLAQHLYEKGRAFSGGWNFGADDEDQKTVQWVVENLLSLWGSPESWQKDPVPPLHEAPFLALNCSKAKEKLEWSPLWKPEVALEESITWYKAFFEKKIMAEITLQQIISYEKLLHDSGF
ncbi:MAG: CDP-glucose 4,6-dehydratase [Candidatus Gracilibacteria bacterium]